MPFIHIKTLPFDPPLNTQEIIESIAQDFSDETGVGLEHITVTWEYLGSGHYAVAGKVASIQPTPSHPVLVDILAPDFNQADMVEIMLRAVASSISGRTQIPMSNIFINYRQAHAGMVFDGGDIIRW